MGWIQIEPLAIECVDSKAPTIPSAFICNGSSRGLNGGELDRIHLRFACRDNYLRLTVRPTDIDWSLLSLKVGSMIPLVGELVLVTSIFDKNMGII